MADTSDHIGRGKVVIAGDIKPLTADLKKAEQATTQSMGRMGDAAQAMGARAAESGRAAATSIASLATSAKTATASFRAFASSVTAVVGAFTRLASVLALAVGGLIAAGKAITYWMDSSERARATIFRATNAIEDFRVAVGLVELTDHQKRIDSITAAYGALNEEILKVKDAGRQQQLFLEGDKVFREALKKARDEEDRRIQDEEAARMNRELISEEKFFEFKRKLWQEQRDREAAAREEARRLTIEAEEQRRRLIEDINEAQLRAVRELNRERIRGLNEYADALARINEQNLSGFAQGSLEGIRQEVERIGRKLGRGS